MPRAVLLALVAVTVTGCLFGGEDKHKQKLVKGRKVFAAECSSCHVVKTTRNERGPHLVDVVGRKAGSVATYPNYSPALKRADFKWKPKRLKAYIRDPDGTLPGTNMPYAGLHGAAKLETLITYLKAPHAAPAPKKKKKKSGGGGNNGGDGGGDGGGDSGGGDSGGGGDGGH